MTFRTDLEIRGQAAYTPPKDGLELDVDGEFVRRIAAAAGVGPRSRARSPLTFTHRFATEGSHLVSLIVKPDAAPGASRDTLPDDNRQDFAVEVTPPLPVLIVDGDPDPAAEDRRQIAARRPVAGEGRDAGPPGQGRVDQPDFDPTLLTAGPDGGPAARADSVQRGRAVEAAAEDAVEQFLADGGGVLATLGGRVDKDDYNLQLYRDGRGWLPAKLTGLEGDETQPKDAAHPCDGAAPRTRLMELFRNEPLRRPGRRPLPTLVEDRRLRTRTPPASASATLKSPTGGVLLPGGAPLQGRPRAALHRAARQLVGHEPDRPAGVRAAGARAGLLPGRRPLGGVQPAARPADPLPPGRATPCRTASACSRRSDDEKPLAIGPPTPDTYPAQVTPQPRGSPGLRRDARDRRLPPQDAGGPHRLLRRPARPARVGPDRRPRRGARDRVAQVAADAVPERARPDPRRPQRRRPRPGLVVVAACWSA